MPAVESLYREELQAAGVHIVGVSQFNTTEAETVAFVERNGLTFPNVYDESAQLATAYGISGVPTYVFLDKEGRIAPPQRRRPRRGLDSILAERPAGGVSAPQRKR